MATTGDDWTRLHLRSGVALRHLRVPDDYRAMNRIANAMRAAEGHEWATSDEQFQSFYEHLSNCDPARDVAIAEQGQEIVGYARATWVQEPDASRVYYPIVFVDPQATNPSDLTADLLEVTEARVGELAAEHPAGNKRMRVEVGATAERTEALVDARGYRPVRYEYLMVRPSLDDLPGAPLPPGLEIREVQPEHMRQIWDAAIEAFADSWGSTVPTEAEFQHFATDPVEGDTTLWRVAWEGDQVAGMVRSYINIEENRRYGRKRGHVEHICVRKPWRRRGLARALIAASFPLLRARGMTEGALGVDTQNQDNALRLYQSCGFVVEGRTSIWEKAFA